MDKRCSLHVCRPLALRVTHFNFNTATARTKFKAQSTRTPTKLLQPHGNQVSKNVAAATSQGRKGPTKPPFSMTWLQKRSVSAAPRLGE